MAAKAKQKAPAKKAAKGKKTLAKKPVKKLAKKLSAKKVGKQVAKKVIKGLKKTVKKGTKALAKGKAGIVDKLKNAAAGPAPIVEVEKITGVSHSYLVIAKKGENKVAINRALNVHFHPAGTVEDAGISANQIDYHRDRYDAVRMGPEMFEAFYAKLPRLGYEVMSRDDIKQNIARL